MPPFIPKKRLASTPPPSSKSTPVKKAKLADILDAEARNGPPLQRTKTFSLGSDDSDSSLSDVDSDQFENVPSSTRPQQKPNTKVESSESDEDDEFEDVQMHKEGVQDQPEGSARTDADGTLQLKFDVGDDMIDYSSMKKQGKQGPTKREKQARKKTHQIHVRYLLWHNAIRNRWICDSKVQQTLIAQLPSQIKKEVEKWKRASGLPEENQKAQVKPQKGKKGKRGRPANPRVERDWGRPSEKLDAGQPDMSRGDPIVSLLKVLTAYWRKRFAITAPGLRKRGYGTKLQLRRDIESYRNDEHDAEKHGERIRDLQEFREVAKKCEGSRDVGAQLFTALLRGLGIESRLVASLQPAGYGFAKAEQIVPRKPASNTTKSTLSESSESEVEATPKVKPRQKSPTSKGKQQKPPRKSKGNKDAPIDLDSEVNNGEESDDDSVVDITPSLPKQRAAKYDRELAFPIYWTEAISPITKQVIPVDPLVIDKPVATTSELVSNFEPRGAKAESARLVIAYVVGYSDDGTAKDVTIRYLRKHIWPGKTKAFRYPIERLPVYDRAGRIKRHEDYDWFKYIMSGYVRTDTMRTALDDVEDSTDLVPQVPEKKDVDNSIDTLQSLKSSAEFVLERFLRREEALRPEAKVDRVFISGKGDNIKSEPVYRRDDVERCLTAESWHKEGREPKSDEQPMKMVPVRAVTLTRKREAEEHERLTGQKQLQGLYSWDQTEYITPPPIEDGIIPKNSYGNIDCFVPSMVPKGAVHIPFRGTVRICKRLEVDFAEAVVGFEFGNKRAVPVINGVVIAKEREAEVRKAWKEWNDEQKKKDAVKQEKLILDLWRKFVMGLRIRERVGEMYGDNAEDVEAESELPVHLKKGITSHEPIDVDEDGTTNATGPGGFEPEDESMTGGGFLLSDDEERSEMEDLVIENHHHSVPMERSPVLWSDKDKQKKPDSYASTAAAHYPTPTSIPSGPKGKGKPALKGEAGTRLRQVSHQQASESSISDLSDEATDSDDQTVKSNAHAQSTQTDEPNDLSSPSHSDSDSEPSSSSLSSDSSPSSSEDEDNFRPTSTPKATPHPPTTSRSTRSRNATSQSNVKVVVDTPSTSTSKTTSTPTRRSRSQNQKGGSTGMKSPYFKKGKKQ